MSDHGPGRAGPPGGNGVHAPTPVEAAELEAELCRLPDVQIARVVTDEDDAVREVHVVAGSGKPAKQVARDVQSVALASFGLELDRRIVSVVQLGDDESGAGADARPAPFRPTIVSVATEASGLRSTVRVTLAQGAVEATGGAEGSVAASARFRLVAAATIAALRELLPGAEGVDVDHAEIVRVGGHDVAVVTVVFVEPPVERIVAGAALVLPQQEAEAVARAVLDATNRRLAHAVTP